jgi:2-amino-4-hydroxy-6-hydroxymethyldihydropteridine diphosphokinase
VRYFVGLGSNIEPRSNIPLMLRALLQLSPTVHVSRVVETVPVGMDGAPFLNAAAALTVDLSPAELKAHFNAVEAALGRNRADPASKTRSRTADLDILFALEPGAMGVPSALLPSEPYVRPTLLELLDALGVPARETAPALGPGVALSLDGLAFGATPRTFTRTGDRSAVSYAALHPSAFILHP